MAAPTRLINLNIPSALLQELNDIAAALGRARTHVILRSLARDLPTLRLEASKALQHRQIREREFGAWEAT